MRVLVCDDIASRGDQVVAAVREAVPDCEVSPLFAGELASALERLFLRVDSCIEHPEGYNPADELPFDLTDLAIFDNNLAHLNIKGARLTAESIVGYVRAFTNCQYLVSLNKNPDVDFDLRYLVGDYETRADLSLNAQHLDNRALWTGKAADAQQGFFPWYWPVLSQVMDRRRAQIDFVRNNLDKSIFTTLGFPMDEEALGFLSLHAKGTLSPDANPAGSEEEGIGLGELTFRHVFESKGRSLPAKEEREKILSVSSTHLDGVIARVVAADIDLWFRRDVIAPQEMLIDVPHLLERMPFLLGENANQLAAWNRAVTEAEVPFGMEEALFAQHLHRSQFLHDVWLPKPAFWWPELRRNDQLSDMFFKADQNAWPDIVFCEDRSEFVPREQEPAPVEFTAEFEGSWARRHVAKIEGMNYRPQTRLVR